MSRGTLWIFDGGRRYTLPIHVSPQIQAMLVSPPGTVPYAASWRGLMDIVRQRIAEERASITE